MTKWDAGTITTNGVETPVQVDDYSGKWHADYAGKNLSYETRDKLEAALKRLTKQTKVEVEVHVIRVRPYSGWSDDGGNIVVTRGTLTGLHAGTGNVLADWTVRGQSQKEQLTRDSNIVYVGGDTSDEALSEYNHIRRTIATANRAKGVWEKAHVVEPKAIVEAAIRAKSGSDED